MIRSASLVLYFESQTSKRSTDMALRKVSEQYQIRHRIKEVMSIIAEKIRRPDIWSSEYHQGQTDSLLEDREGFLNILFCFKHAFLYRRSILYRKYSRLCYISHSFLSFHTPMSASGVDKNCLWILIVCWLTSKCFVNQVGAHNVVGA